MPLEKFCCSICGTCAPKKYLEHRKSKERLSWLKHHYQGMHPYAFKKWGK